MDTLSLIIHVTAAAVLVGPQFLMFYAVTPATFLIDDERLKREVLKVVARRFARLAGIALVLLIVTGTYQLVSMVPTDIRDNMFSFRYGQIFVMKMTLLAVLIALIVIHGAVLARRVSRLSDEVLEGRGDPGVLETARAQSLVFSGVMLIVSLAVLMLGVALGNHGFSYVTT